MSIPDRELVLPHLVHRAAWRGGTPSRDHHRGDRPTPRMCSRLSTPTSSTLRPDGDPNVGDPIQYDELRIEHDHGEVEIIVYNRAILTHPSLDAPRAPGRARCSRPT